MTIWGLSMREITGDNDNPRVKRGRGKHFTIWRKGRGRGERVSWDQYDGDTTAQNAHHTDQDNDAHSMDPADWRALNETW